MKIGRPFIGDSRSTSAETAAHKAARAARRPTPSLVVRALSTAAMETCLRSSRRGGDLRRRRRRRRAASQTLKLPASGPGYDGAVRDRARGDLRPSATSSTSTTTSLSGHGTKKSAWSAYRATPLRRFVVYVERADEPRVSWLCRRGRRHGGRRRVGFVLGLLYASQRRRPVRDPLYRVASKEVDAKRLGGFGARRGRLIIPPLVSFMCALRGDGGEGPKVTQNTLSPAPRGTPAAARARPRRRSVHLAAAGAGGTGP